MSDLFRAIPAVDASLNALLDVDPTLEAAPRPLLRTAVTEFWDALREDIRQGRVTRPADLALDANLSALLAHVRRALLPRLRPVLNARAWWCTPIWAAPYWRRQRRRPYGKPPPATAAWSWTLQPAAAAAATAWWKTCSVASPEPKPHLWSTIMPQPYCWCWIPAAKAARSLFRAGSW